MNGQVLLHVTVKLLELLPNHWKHTRKNRCSIKKQKKRENHKRWYDKNYKKYFLKNKERILKKSRELKKKKWKTDIEYREKTKKIHEKWKNKNRSYYLEYQKNYEKNRTLEQKRKRKLAIKKRIKNDPSTKLAMNIRRRVLLALKGSHKAKPTIKLLGCTIEELWQHFESKFQPGMTRENHGKWHVDHIKPCASFDLTDPKQQEECFHYTNLQPLWAEQNLKKGKKYETRKNILQP